VGPDGTPNSPCSPWPACTSADPLSIGTLGQRATFFQNKITAALEGGVPGYVIWVKSPYYTATTNGYAIGDGDPTEMVMLGVLSSPGTNVPEAPWAAGLAAVALLVFAGGWIVIRRRRRVTMAETPQ
jgi:hypothetical protein